VNVRVLAATNKDLNRATRESRFREDLLFRLNVLPVHIAPLRDRVEDVPPLVRHFLTRQATRLGRSLSMDAGALQLLVTYPWPGNVRELANLVERLAILASSDVITATEISRVLPTDGAARAVAGAGGNPDTPLAAALDQYERQLIASALSVAKGNVADAARRLSTDRANLYRRMRRLGLEPPRQLSE
jgi:two-component system, NtrC family, nitrogen regulation response regulator NtrX